MSHPEESRDTKTRNQGRSTLRARPGPRRRSRSLPWLAVVASAVVLAVPVTAASADQSPRASQYPTAREIAIHGGRLPAKELAHGSQFPTARQIAMHEGQLPAKEQPAQNPQFPTARQIAIHEGGRPQNLPPVTAAPIPASGGNGNALPIVFSSVALFVALAGTGMVLARGARIRRQAG